MSTKKKPCRVCTILNDRTPTIHQGKQLHTDTNITDLRITMMVEANRLAK
jgi:hypothetical protein